MATAAAIREPRTYAFSDEGLEITAESFNSRVAWKNVVTAERHRDQILLGTAQKQFYVVPVHDFESQEQLEGFVRLVRSKVAKCGL